LASTEPKSASLPNGARLEWTPETRTLSATRLNRGLETQPSEQRIFEAHIRRAGYEHGPAAFCTYSADAVGNERIGVTWKVMPAKRAAASDAQLSLF
jgi:hypothetical protein